MALTTCLKPLSLTFEWSSCNIAHCFTPLQPGEFGQASNAFLEMISRLFFATISVPLLFIGLVGRAIQELIPCESFEFREGEAPAKIYEGEFTQFSLNVCFFEGALPLLFGGVEPWWKRVDDVADLILEQDADVVNLQEVFSRHASEALYERLKERYRYFYMNIGDDSRPFFGFNSGLFVASKFPIEDPRFVAFNDSEQTKSINKGFFAGKIASGGNHFQILNTHLEPHAGPEKAAIRLRQLKKIEDHLNENPHMPSYIVGDFNIIADSEEYRETLGRGILGAIPPLERRVITSTDYFQNRRWGYSHDFNEDYRVDYGALRGGRMISERFIATYDLSHPESAISDHTGRLAHIAIA